MSSRTKYKQRVILTPDYVLRELRLKKGWTQAKLSEITGIAVSNISNMENGRSRIGEDRAIIIATAMGIGPEILLFPNGYEREDLKERLDQIRVRLKKSKSVA